MVFTSMYLIIFNLFDFWQLTLKDMLDGMFQTFLGLTLGKAGLPYNMEEFQYFTPPKSSSVRAEVIYHQELGIDPPEGVVNTGSLRLYP